MRAKVFGAERTKRSWRMTRLLNALTSDSRSSATSWAFLQRRMISEMWRGSRELESMSKTRSNCDLPEGFGPRLAGESSSG